MELLLQPRRTVQVVGIDDDDDPASPFEVAQPGFVGLDAIDVRGVSVVLDRDTQLLVPEIKAVHLATVDGADGDVRLRYGKPQVDNQPEQPALRGRVGAAGRQVDESPTDTGAARIGSFLQSLP